MAAEQQAESSVQRCTDVSMSSLGTCTRYYKVQQPAFYISKVLSNCETRYN
jgi:hypothetical protein